MEKYSGNKYPYIYALFDEADTKATEEVLELLDQNNYRLSYQEKKNKNAILRSSAVLLFISGRVLNNKKIMEETTFASENGKEIIAIFLEETELTPGLSMLLGTTQGIMRYSLSDEEFQDRLFNSDVIANLQLSKQQKRSSRNRVLAVIIPIVAAIAAAAVLLIVLNPFSSSAGPLFQKLGISGNLNGIKKVYVYGEQTKDDYKIAQFIIDADHTYDRINLIDEIVETGEISDISEFAQLKNLEELCLCGNQVETIAPILSLEKLKVLDLSHNYGVDISGISSLPKLETLNIAETEIEDLTEVKSIPSLKTLYICASQLSAVDELGEIGFEIICVNRPVYSFEELRTALEDPNAYQIQIMNSLEIPANETIDIPKGKMIGGAGIDIDMIITNNGTVNIYGAWEMGLCTRNNNGAIIVKDGGLYSGGMCDTHTYGTFTVEKGGKQCIERGHIFMVEDGTYRNDGDLILSGGGALEYMGGSFRNDGIIDWNRANDQPGPFIHLNGPDYSGSGKIYFKGDEITLGEVNAHNPTMGD